VPADGLVVKGSDVSGNGTDALCGTELTCGDLVACAPPTLDAESVCGTSLRMDALPQGGGWDVCGAD
jgi:hypothetical protein